MAQGERGATAGGKAHHAGQEEHGSESAAGIGDILCKDVLTLRS